MLYYQSIAGYYWSFILTSNSNSYNSLINWSHLVKADSFNKRYGFSLRRWNLICYLCAQRRAIPRRLSLLLALIRRVLNIYRR